MSYQSAQQICLPNHACSWARSLLPRGIYYMFIYYTPWVDAPVLLGRVSTTNCSKNCKISNLDIYPIPSFFFFFSLTWDHVGGGEVSNDIFPESTHQIPSTKFIILLGSVFIKIITELINLNLFFLSIFWFLFLDVFGRCILKASRSGPNLCLTLLILICPTLTKSLYVV